MCVFFFFFFIQWSYLDFVAFFNKFCTLAKSEGILRRFMQRYLSVLLGVNFFFAISCLNVVVVVFYSHTQCVVVTP